MHLQRVELAQLSTVQLGVRLAGVLLAGFGEPFKRLLERANLSSCALVAL